MKASISRFSFFAVLAICFSACTNDASKYYLLSDTANDVESGTAIVFNGLIVGEVDDLGFEGQKIKITFDVRKDLQIGKTSTFRVIKTGLFEYSLEINGKGDTQFYKPGSKIYSNITYEQGPIDLLVSAADSIGAAMRAGDTQLRKLGDYKEGKKSYEVYSFYHKKQNASFLSGQAHVIFVSAGDTIAYDMESEYSFPEKFDGTYFYCLNSSSRYKFNGLSEVLCVKDGCFERDYPDFGDFRKAVK